MADLARQELPHDNAKAVHIRLWRQLRLRQQLWRHVRHGLQGRAVLRNLPHCAVSG